MAWLYVPEWAESNSAPNAGCAPSATSKARPVQLRFSVAGLLRDNSTRGRSGMTSAPSTGHRGVDRWIASLRDSPARTSALRAAVAAWKASAAVFSSRSVAWPRKSSPLGYSLRTSWGFANTSAALGENWPISASIVAGILYPQRRWGPAKSAIVGGHWPTLRTTTGDYTRDQVAKGKERLTTGGAAKVWSGLRATDGAKGGPGQSFGAGGVPLPAQAVRWATLTTRDFRGLEYRIRDGNQGPTLTQQVAESLPRLGLTTGKVGGRTSPDTLVLNPRFCEALMGFPIGWLTSVPSGTGRIRPARKKRLRG